MNEAIKPMVIDGEEYYIISMHPHQLYSMQVETARQKYKHQSHKRRWEKRYKKPYRETEGEIALTESIRFLQ